MKILVLCGAAVAALCCSCVPNQENKLFFDAPAAYWEEAFPIGNGRIGAMVYGDPVNEQLQLNEETIWSGSPYENWNPKGLEALPKMRQLIFEGKYEEAQKVGDECMLSPVGEEMQYQTAGTLNLHFPDRVVTGYSRELDLNTAVTRTSYKVGDVSYVEEAFASFTDQLIVVRISADKARSINFSIDYSTPMPEPAVSVPSDCILRLEGNASEKGGLPGAIHYIVDTKVDVKDGRVAADSLSLRVEDASEAVLHIAMATNFVNYRDVSGNAAEKVTAYMSGAGTGYEKAKKSHIRAYSEQFNTLTLNLGTSADAHKSLEKRIAEYKDTEDPQLVQLYFQFGRYLLLCCSQPGTQPANLQGIWNWRLKAPWCGNYTTNINTEMNYWPAEITNMAQLHEPLVKMIGELAESGASTARNMYGCRGWVLHHNSDLWRCTGALDYAYCGLWPTGGAWLCQHLWDRYLYSGDRDYLSEVYPLMKSASEFFVDYLVEDPSSGYLVAGPSCSPENRPYGKKSNLYMGITMDNQLISDLFSNVESAAAALGGVDSEFCDTLRAMRRRLPPMKVGQYGQLQEWFEDWDNPQDHHRHVSHLWGLYPGYQISPYRTPELFEAVRNSLNQRGDASTGWSMGWKVCLWARQLDGNHAFKLIKDQLSLVDPSSQNGQGGGTYPNFFDAHPPFQIDGNFGCTAGIAELFVQSHDGAVQVLPALPDAWASAGQICGLRARGGFVIEKLAWKDGKISELVIRSTIGGNLRLRSYDVLKGKSLVEVCDNTINSNPLFAVQEISAPQISGSAILEGNDLKPVHVYDCETVPGQKIVIRP